MLTLIIPVFNEEYNLSKNFDKLYKRASELSDESEIIIAEDGSADGTYALAKELEAAHDNIRLSHSDKRLGKGLAIKRALSIAKGDKVCYIDIDLSSDISSLTDMNRYLDNYDIVIGSRLIKRNYAERKIMRYIFSVGYNMLIRCLFGSKIRDHQCGFKAFRKAVIQDLASRTSNNRWFFDTELLLRAQDRSYRIKEIPVLWKEGNKTKVRINSVIFQMLTDIMRFFLAGKRTQ